MSIPASEEAWIPQEEPWFGADGYEDEDLYDLCVTEAFPVFGKIVSELQQINPDLYEYVCYEVCSMLSKRISADFRTFLKGTVWTKPTVEVVKSSREAITRAKASPYFIRVDFATNLNPPGDEWIGHITNSGEILEHCKTIIVHRDFGGSEDLFFSSEKGQVKDELTFYDHFTWSEEVRGIDWLHDWMLPCFRKGVDPIGYSNKDAFEAFCKEKGIDQIWNPEEYTYDLWCMTSDMLGDFSYFPDEPTKVYKDTELWDLYLAGKVPKRFMDDGPKPGFDDPPRQWFGYWGYE